MSKKVLESTEYDNFIDKSVATEEEHNPLSDFIEENASFGTDKINDWRMHWKEMPEYEHDDAKPFKTVYVHFRNQEDYDEFAEKISQILTPKTKSIWYPKMGKDDNMLKRWQETDED